MKKIIISIFAIIFLMPVFAKAEIIPKTIYAISHTEENYSDFKAGKELTFSSLDNYDITELYSVEKNSLIKIKIEKYIKPKRGKRNGYLKIQLISYTIPSRENAVKNTEKLGIYGTLRLSNPADKIEIAKHIGVTVVGQILKIPGFTQAIAVSKGLISPNPEQNRLQSAGTNLYESTPLTFGEKGENLKLEEDSIIVMRLKTQKNQDSNNGKKRK